ncbi:MAG TPA: indole-3-glycerol phosphate synthase TrpC [Terriglobales bacterium]|nr:indole-3-glycerol phosphate synthase TrpC [Terriglobales bacterium]
MAGLADILAATQRKVEKSISTADLAQLEQQAGSHNPRGFRRAIESVSGSGVAIIAELKKASPSRGVIRNDFDPAKLARELEVAGAAALSVLTDDEYFQGSLENLRIASSETRLPCLRKDFIIDEFQILEARANCADAVLLIVAALAQAEVISLAKRAKEFQLDVLCEVHDEEELGRALDAGCDLVGVNSRDLQTLKVDLDTAFRVAQMLPPEAIAVAESGIEKGRDIAALRSAGYNAFLIGESLMRASAPGEALRRLLTEAGSAASAGI